MEKRNILTALLLGGLMLIIKMLEYRFVVIDDALELYGVGVAIIFTLTGIAIGRMQTRNKVVETEAQALYIPQQRVVFHPEKLGISKREFELLELMAVGLSNQEIAQRMYLSIHTVKTHASNLFGKLDVKSRTQAVLKAKELRLIP